MSQNDATNGPDISFRLIQEFGPSDLDNLCDAAETAIIDGGGFGWIVPPVREVLEAYWRGVLLIPDRDLIVGALDGVIAGCCQIHRPPKNNEAQGFACNLTTHFVAPWARGHGLSRGLIEAAENHVRSAGFRVINLDVRATQHGAIRLYEQRGYVRFGVHPHYARVQGEPVAGYFYYKNLAPEGAENGPENGAENGAESGA